MLSRRAFFQRLLAGATAAAGVAIVVAQPRAIERFVPRPLRQGDYQTSEIVAREFLRVFSGGIAHIPRRTLAFVEPWGLWDIAARKYVNISIEWKPELSLDEVAPFVQSAAEALADFVCGEHDRGGRMLNCFRLPHPHRDGGYAHAITTSTVDHISTRMIIHTAPVWDRENFGGYEMVTMARFDVCYLWEKQPLRERRSFAYAPSRLPA